MANIPGTSNRDTIYGTNFDDILNQDGDPLSYPGTGGNDYVYGLEGNDRLYGGSGNDNLDGGVGNDRLSGGVDDDALFGDSGNDQLFGGTGSDYLYAGDGNDFLNGDTGADRMYGGAGSDTYYVDNVGDVAEETTNDALGGRDQVYSSATHTLGFGIENLFMTGVAAINGTGNANGNSMFGNDANNILSGLEGDDAINGGNGNDQLFGGNGNDVLSGASGNDMLKGEAGTDALFGGTGNDQLFGGDGNDLLDGNSGDDVLNGGAGIDVVNYESVAAGVRVNLALTGAQNTVGAGIDTFSQVENVTGSSFNDILTGNAGNNSLYGGNGNDVLTGGSGRDLLNGGADNDRFDYNAVSESPDALTRDVITGFAGNGTALGDQIDLRDIDANVLVTGNQAFTWKGTTPGGAGTLWHSRGVLYGNTDGDAAAELEIQLVGIRGLSVGGTGTDILL